LAWSSEKKTDYENITGLKMSEPFNHCWLYCNLQTLPKLLWPDAILPDSQSPANENHGLNVAEHPNKLFLVELKSFHWSSKLLSFFISFKKITTD